MQHLFSIMKRVNHRGSAIVLVVLLLLVGVMVSSMLNATITWKPKTTLYRLVNDPFAGWSLAFVLCGGLLLLRVGSEFAQCVAGLTFVGFVFGISIVSALFWDAWLSVVLISAVGPIQQSCLRKLASLVPAEKVTGGAGAV